MTRINTIDVSLLTDQHLLAEYKEYRQIIPSFRRSLNAKKFPEIPPTYRLNKGHVKFFYNKAPYLHSRYWKLVSEMERRGYKPVAPEPYWPEMNQIQQHDWTPDIEAHKVNLGRILWRVLNQNHTYCKEPVDYVHYRQRVLRYYDLRQIEFVH